MTVCYGFVCRRRMEMAFTGRRARHADAYHGQWPRIARGRAQSDSAGLRLVRSPGGAGSRHLQAASPTPISGISMPRTISIAGTPRATTTSLLLVLQAWGALRYHTVDDPCYRGNILVGPTAAQHRRHHRTKERHQMGRRHVDHGLRPGAGSHAAREVARRKIAASSRHQRDAPSAQAKPPAAGAGGFQTSLSWRLAPVRGVPGHARDVRAADADIGKLAVAQALSSFRL